MILAILEKERLPLTAKEIWKRLPAPKSDLVSIYRAMDRFEKEGIALTVRFGDSSIRYELKRGHHHHVRCTKCGKVADVDLCVKDIERKVLRQSGFRVAFHDFQLVGLCKTCSKRVSGLQT